MRFSKWFVWLALAGGVALPGASTLSAQERRDLRHDYANADRLRADLTRDQWRYNEAVRCGRPWEAQRISRDMARDRQALDYQLRDIRHDRVRRDYDRNAWR